MLVHEARLLCAMSPEALRACFFFGGGEGNGRGLGHVRDPSHSGASMSPTTRRGHWRRTRKGTKERESRAKKKPPTKNRCPIREKPPNQGAPGTIVGKARNGLGLLRLECFQNASTMLPDPQPPATALCYYCTLWCTYGGDEQSPTQAASALHGPRATVCTCTVPCCTSTQSR